MLFPYGISDFKEIVTQKFKSLAENSKCVREKHKIIDVPNFAQKIYLFRIVD